jgi:hypothetical protein
MKKKAPFPGAFFYLYSVVWKLIILEYTVVYTKKKYLNLYLPSTENYPLHLNRSFENWVLALVSPTRMAWFYVS